MAKKKLTDFEVMDKMASENMDIAMCPDMIAAEKIRKGGKITFGVTPEIFEKVINSTAHSVGITDKGEEYYAIMYVINKKQFLKLKND